MNETCINIRRTFVTHDQPTEVLYLGVGALDNPAFVMFSQFPGVLMCRLMVVLASRDNGLNAQVNQIIAGLCCCHILCPHSAFQATGQ